MTNPAATFEAILAAMLTVSLIVAVVWVIRGEMLTARQKRAYLASIAAPNVTAANEACAIAWETVNARRLPDGRARATDIDAWDAACELRDQLHARARRTANAVR